jgi:hypothetical protein
MRKRFKRVTLPEIATLESAILTADKGHFGTKTPFWMLLADYCTRMALDAWDGKCPYP